MDKIVQALVNEGRMPIFHRRKLAQLRREWPVLFNVLRMYMTEQGYVYDGWKYVKKTQGQFKSSQDQS